MKPHLLSHDASEQEVDCGAEDSVTGATCTRPPHAGDELHHDDSDPSSEVKWSSHERVRLWLPSHVRHQDGHP